MLSVWYTFIMQIAKNAIYALRICKVLKGVTTPQSLAKLGQAIDLDPRGVQQVMLPLLRERIVVSQRGSNSGYLLVAKRLTVGTVVQAFGSGICPEIDGDNKYERAVRRKIRACVLGALRKMKLDDI